MTRTRFSRRLKRGARWRIRNAFLVAFGLALAAACADDSGSSLDADRHLLELRQSEFQDALLARDADRLAEVFADTAVMHVANMPPIEGRDAIRDFYRNMFGFLDSSTATPEAIHLSGAGDMAAVVGTTRNAFRGPQGRIEYSGKYSLVWIKPADEWLILLYSVSSNEP